MDLKQCSDEELIVRYRDGDTDAMDFIFERYKHLVRKKAKAMFLAGGDNDDLIQEGMIGLYKAIRDYRPGGFFCDLCKYVHQSSDDYGGGGIKP